MDYIQNFFIIIMEVICFFLFQDIFVPGENKYKNGVYAVWIFTLSFIALILSYVFENSFILKEIAMIVLFFCSIVILKRRKKRMALLAAVMFIFLLVIADVITILLDTKVFVVKNNDIQLVDMIIILMSKSILLIIILCLRKFTARKWNDFQKQTNLMRYAIIPFISICLMALILSNDMGMLNAKMRYLMWACQLFL